MAQKRYATNITTPNGKRVYISAKSKAELEKKVLQAKIEMHSGVDITDNSTFSDYGETWMKAYKSPPKISQHSSDLAWANYRLHVLPFFEAMRLRDVKPIHITQFIASLDGKSNSLQSKCLQLVKGIFTSAAENGLISKSPILKEHRPQGIATEEKVPLTEAQAKEFLDNLRGHRPYLFVLLGLTTGMRRGEILGLMWEDIDFDENLIHIRHNLSFGCNDNHAEITTKLKTKTSRRDVPLADCTKAALLAMPRSRPWVFTMQNGQPYSKSTFHAMWESALLYLPRGLDRCHPHLLRHTFTVQCIESGMDPTEVQHLLGHKNISVTMGIYNHYRESSRKDITAQRLNNALSYLS